MSNIMKYSANLESFIEDVIFKYCPYMEDRLHILGNAQCHKLILKLASTIINHEWDFYLAIEILNKAFQNRSKRNIMFKIKNNKLKIAICIN